MFKNKAGGGRNNIVGKEIARLRKAVTPKMSQRMLADRCQLFGLDVDKNAIQRIESGQRFVTDIELLCLCKIFKVRAEDLLSAGEKDFLQDL